MKVCVKRKGHFEFAEAYQYLYSSDQVSDVLVLVPGLSQVSALDLGLSLEPRSQPQTQVSAPRGPLYTLSDSHPMSDSYILVLSNACMLL